MTGPDPDSEKLRSLQRTRQLFWRRVYPGQAFSWQKKNAKKVNIPLLMDPGHDGTGADTHYPSPE